MQPQSAQNMYVPQNAAGNNNGNVRTNPQSNNNMFRQTPSSPAPRNRFMPNTMFPSTVQSVVLQQFPYPARQPQYQQFSYAGHQYYQQNSYYSFYPLQQPPQHQRTATLSVNSGVNVGVGSGISGAVAGPTTANQAQITLSVPPVGNAVLGVTNATPTQPVGVNTLVSVMQSPQPTTRKIRRHALEIIDPNTNRNILEDLKSEKNTSSTDIECQDSISAAQLIQTKVPEEAGHVMRSTSEFRNYDTDTRETSEQEERNTINQTPVVSAMLAPEIYPAQMQKTKSKKMQINKADQNVRSIAKPDEEARKQPRNNESAIGTNSENIHQEIITQNYTVDKSSQVIPANQQLGDSEMGGASSSENSLTLNSLTLGKVDHKLERASRKICLNDESATNESCVGGVSNLHTTKLGEKELLTSSRNTVSGNEQQTQKQTISLVETNDNFTSPLDTPNNGSAEESENNIFEKSSKGFNNSSIICDDTAKVIAIEIGVCEADLNETNSAFASKLDNNENIKELIETSKNEDIHVNYAKSNVLVSPLEKSTNFSNDTSLTTKTFSMPSPNHSSTSRKKYNREQLMDLRDVKNSRIQPDIKITSILPGFNLMPAFAVNNANKKFQPLVGSIGGNSSFSKNYTKQVSNSSTGGAHITEDSKPMIHVNLSLNQDVQLNEIANAWRPRILLKTNEIDNDPKAKSQREKEELVRRVRGILNKLTPEKFDPLVKEIMELKIDTMEKMEAVMILVFEKAIDEPNFSVCYARLCARLISEVKAKDEKMESGTKTHLVQFRNALLDKTEREFTYNVIDAKAKEQKLKPIRDKIQKCKDSHEKVELEALLEEEERKIRRRSGGTVRFIGELFKISILAGKIVVTCIESLIKYPDNEDMLECLCKLLTTVGQKLEQNLLPREQNRLYTLDGVIQRMQAIASKSENTKISSRVRFMLQDVIDLRKNKWKSAARARNETPTTLDQIENEAKNEEYYNYSVSLSNAGGLSGGGGKRDDRINRFGDNRLNYNGSHSQRGDVSSLKRTQHMSSGSHSASGNEGIWHVQTGKGSRPLAVDPNKLGALHNFDITNKKMGGVQQFQWPKSTPIAIPSNSFAALSVLDSNKSGSRQKTAYTHTHNKGSTERDRYDRGLLPRSGSSQASREHSSSRISQPMRNMTTTTSMQKSASHSKYIQSSSTPRLACKPTSFAAIPPGSGSSSVSCDKPDDDQSVAQYQQLQREHQHVHIACETGLSSPPEAVFEEPSDADLKLIKSVVSEIVENAANSKQIDFLTVTCIERIRQSQLCGLLYYIITDYLHLRDVGSFHRRLLSNCIAYLIERNYLSIDHFNLAYEHFASIANEIIVDVPDMYLYILEFTGPLIVKKILTIHDLWTEKLRKAESSNCEMGKKFLKTYLQYCTREIGPSFTRSMFKKFNMKWSDYIPEVEIETFIQSNKFEFVENDKYHPEIDTRETKEKRYARMFDHIEQILKEDANADNVIDYINGNIVDVDKLFIRGLTTTLASFAIKDSSNYKLDAPCFQKKCIPVLIRYIDSKEERELECLYALQLLVHNLEHPRHLISDLFIKLNEYDVIPQDTFRRWRESTAQTVGKGVAVKALNPFFNQILNGETSDDN
ncbi:eukaryotic translation initiation factor 4 gamma 3 isoform X1 [Glossina fuscipes]|uniref:Eukaryotic translation initiation factor 4 gamma 3 isoform X1 n=1 Tax=Glossina fuscipes TaxID=7396 RepID=A0A9C6E0R4_9MUSC|nr:eukaryotic translation initiation factor 4 gamma 3 isoform X1 [Glossina fuscipes]XP_037898953.1 eukaryotic translation initiation factor 4 gamma 3 isoform X2 [Glossina fuscipes]XP_037898954.1 eukaryotic translation initiation factor 4 gamma 3 isoform X1 [Glossina fuscipes]